MQPPAWNPPTDMFEMEDQLIVRVEIAGMQQDDFTVELNGRQLSIRGVRQDSTERRAYHQMEIPFGAFHIGLALPTPVDADHVVAYYGDGFLRIVLPKAHPKRIQVRE